MRTFPNTFNELSICAQNNPAIQTTRHAHNRYSRKSISAQVISLVHSVLQIPVTYGEVLLVLLHMLLLKELLRRGFIFNPGSIYNF
jgi:hypothetical protein